ncbi:MAG: hydantoinase/oxoprolinase family protein [Pseudomonadota bacterium]
MNNVRMGIDVGGTFTDVVATDETLGTVWHHKEPSTPDDPSRAILRGAAHVLTKAGRRGADVSFFGHGTTVITNMILERKGAHVAMLTTRGFRDVLDLGRQARPHVYDYRVRRPSALVARRDRYEVAERVYGQGMELVPLNDAELTELAKRLAAENYDAIVVCFLHAYRAPKHEDRTATILHRAMPDAYVTASNQVAPEYREFERFATTALNGFVGPRAVRYFEALGEGLREIGIAAPVYTVTSNAGLVDLNTAKAIPVRTALSGPAAGVRGIGRILAPHGLGDLVTFDVGGTSTDIAILPKGAPRTARVREVNGHPVLAPMVDIEVIGAGGGSIAQLDPGGAVVVGPESAGANPGPASYGRGGTHATVTDAALVLGRIGAGAGLVGDLHLDLPAAEAVVKKSVGAPLGLSAEEAAQGILEIATAGMARTIRSAALARGVKPEQLCLVAYGGAGPLLGTDVASALGIGRVVVPLAPGTLCARAILVSDIARDFSVTQIIPLAADADLAVTFAGMHAEGTRWLEGEGVPLEDQAFECSIECRYLGQNFEITVPFPENASAEEMRAEFHTLHDKTQGFSLPDREVEAVTFRLTARSGRPDAQPAGDLGQTNHPPTSRRVFFGRGRQETAVFRRSALAPCERIDGPAIIEEDTSTTVIPPGWAGAVLFDGTLSLTRDNAEAT